MIALLAVWALAPTLAFGLCLAAARGDRKLTEWHQGRGGKP